MRIPWLKWILLGLVTVLFLFFPFLLNEFHKPSIVPGPHVPANFMPPPEHRIPYPWVNIYRPELQNLLLIIFFYLNYLWLIPKFLAKGDAKKYALACGLTVLLFVVLTWAMHNFLDHLNHMHAINLLRRFPGLFVSYFLVTGISIGLGLYEDWRKTQSERETLQKAALESELSFLKSQVSPHFLFNTLNNIYSLSVTKSEHAPDAVLKLSGLMRYMLYDASEKNVPVEKELQYLADYIELQKLRLTEKVKIAYEVKGQPGTSEISPLLLIPFVENAFKHGISYSGESTIHISISCSSSELSLHVLNPVAATAGDQKDKSSGVGLANVKKRLALLYPGKYKLDISNDGRHFSVALHLQLGKS
ncbi:MAG: putative two-component system sensor protein, no kinase domain [Bacteroidetes bacterium]|nr:MAG: putative two-component system sensor protein, no kinase domain [Bacteroidota bacterium]